MRYDKLVRDNIPGIIESEGKKQESRMADDAEYETKLNEKLEEEVREFLAADDAVKKEEEMADILEVLDALKAHYGLSEDSIRAIKEKKLKERGGFSKKVILESSE